MVSMIAVAGINLVAGTLTTLNGVAEIGESFFGYNFVKDSVFQCNDPAYKVYVGIAESISIVGSAVCGGWLKANAPRIQAYNNIECYLQTKTVSGHTERVYNNSILLQKQTIKYGKMTKDLQTSTGYVFKVTGGLNGSEKFWRLVVSNSDKLILHFCFGC